MKNSSMSLFTAAVLILGQSFVFSAEKYAALDLGEVFYQAQFSAIENGMRITLPGDDAPMIINGIRLVAEDPDANQIYSGDFAALGVNQVGVTLTTVSGQQVPGEIYMALETKYNGDTVIWRTGKLDMVPDSGVDTRNSIAFDTTAWTTKYPSSMPRQELFEACINNVQQLEIRMFQGPITHQVYDVTMLQLLDADGGFIGSPAILTPLQQALAGAFGGKKSVGELSAAELASATFRKVAAGIDIDAEPEADFNIEVVSVAPEGVTVRWRSAPWAVYTLYRAVSLTEAFTAVADDLRSSGGDFMTYLDSTADTERQYFYRVKLQIEE